jgi:two-component system cell cycle response regulator
MTTHPMNESIEQAPLMDDQALLAPGEKLLVVDDDELIREVLTDLLSEMGYACDIACDGEEAIEKIGCENFELILLDLVLPKMSGQETFEAIKSKDDNLPIIIITGHGSIESAVEFLKKGAVDYLTKPIRFDEFKFRINRALEEVRLRAAAITDRKTQLFNHSYFERKLREEVERAYRYGHSISLIMLDLDNFKDYNDNYGHIAGDAVLKEIGALLRKVGRDFDIPCRFGGEEFSIILPETDLDGAVKVAERIRSAIESASFEDESADTARQITASLGIASCGCYGGHGGEEDVNLLVKHSDRALYEAKRTGKNRVCAVEISPVQS